MNKNTIIIIAIICLVLGGGLIAKNNNQKQAELAKISEELESLKQELTQKDSTSENQNDEETKEDSSDESTSDDVRANWQTYYNSQDGYTIMYPPEFNIYSQNILADYDYNDPQFETGNPNGIQIQIQKINLSPEFSTFQDFIDTETQTPSQFNLEAEQITLGDSITLRQYTTDGPGGPMMSYNAFPKRGTDYFNIIVFEPAYSRNIELVELILETFKME